MAEDSALVHEKCFSYAGMCAFVPICLNLCQGLLATPDTTREGCEKFPSISHCFSRICLNLCQGFLATPGTRDEKSFLAFLGLQILIDHCMNNVSCHCWRQRLPCHCCLAQTCCLYEACYLHVSVHEFMSQIYKVWQHFQITLQFW